MPTTARPGSRAGAGAQGGMCLIHNVTTIRENFGIVPLESFVIKS